MLIDIVTTSPPYKVTQQKAASELKKRMANESVIERLIDMAAVHSGIESRYIVIPDAEEDTESKFYSKNGSYINPGTQLRMMEYEKWSKKLAGEAVAKIIADNKFNPTAIDRIITISCTGFFAPGLDYYLMNEFNIPFTAKRINIGFMGCAASIIGFNSVFETINPDSNTLLVSVELCSLHLQAEPSRDNILANMIFADGCAAALFSKSNETSSTKLEIISTKSILFKNSSDFMGWKIGNFGFEMILSSELPRIILNEAVPSLRNLLLEEGIDPDKVKHWALHPGGRAILDALQKGLNLSEEKMIHSREVLRKYGNMSSASILFVLKEIFNSGNLEKDDLCCAVAFGPGLTMEVALLKGM
jgi:predicted naringenin-chalcone synthase